MGFGPHPSTMTWTKPCCTIYPPATRAKHEKVWPHFSKSVFRSGSLVPRPILKPDLAEGALKKGAGTSRPQQMPVNGRVDFRGTGRPRPFLSAPVTLLRLEL